VLFGLITFNCFSQSGVKWSADGNSPSGNDFFGTNNAFPIVFKTAGIERMRLSESGNFGIGVINPTHKFEVAGNSLFNGDVSISGTLNSVGVVSFDSLHIVDELKIGNSIMLGGNHLLGNNNNRIYTTSLSGDMLIQSENGNNQNTIINGGNSGKVGIGTYGYFLPREKLHVHSDGNQQTAIRLENTIDISGTTHIYAWNIAQSIVGLAFQNGTTQLGGFNPNNDISNMSTKMMIDFNGNVGIGTTSMPLQKLDVQGNGIFSGSVGIGTTNPQQNLDVVRI